MSDGDVLGLCSAALMLVASLAFYARFQFSVQRRKVGSRIERVTATRDTSQQADREDDLFRVLDSARGDGLMGRFNRAIADQAYLIADAGALRGIAFGAVAAGVAAFVGLAYALDLALLPSAASALALAAAVPIIYIRGRIRKRREKFLDVFPDAIDLIVRAIRAGIPASESIATAGRELPAPVGTEFWRISQEIAIGRSPDRVLADTAERVRISEFSFFAVTLTLQRETGGNLAETLEKLSSLLRKRREMRLKITALTAEGRFTAKVIAGLPIFVIGALYFLNRNYMMLLFTDPTAQMFLGIAVGLILAGMFVLDRMMKLEV